MGRILAVPLLLVLALAHDIDQRTQLLPVLLLLCFELLDILQDLVSVSSDETEYALDTIRSKYISVHGPLYDKLFALYKCLRHMIWTGEAEGPEEERSHYLPYDPLHHATQYCVATWCRTVLSLPLWLLAVEYRLELGHSAIRTRQDLVAYRLLDRRARPRHGELRQHDNVAMGQARRRRSNEMIVLVSIASRQGCHSLRHTHRLQGDVCTLGLGHVEEFLFQ